MRPKACYAWVEVEALSKEVHTERFLTQFQRIFTISKQKERLYMKAYSLVFIALLNSEGQVREVLLQQKDGGHPDDRFKFGFTLFGGSTKEATDKGDPMELLSVCLNQRQYPSNPDTAMLILDHTDPKPIIDEAYTDNGVTSQVRFFWCEINEEDIQGHRDPLQHPNEGYGTVVSVEHLRCLLRGGGKFLPNIAACIEEILTSKGL